MAKNIHRARSYIPIIPTGTKLLLLGNALTIRLPICLPLPRRKTPLLGLLCHLLGGIKVLPAMERERYQKKQIRPQLEAGGLDRIVGTQGRVAGAQDRAGIQARKQRTPLRRRQTLQAGAQPRAAGETMTILLLLLHRGDQVPDGARPALMTLTRGGIQLQQCRATNHLETGAVAKNHGKIHLTRQCRCNLKPVHCRRLPSHAEFAASSGSSDACAAGSTFTRQSQDPSAAIDPCCSARH